MNIFESWNTPKSPKEEKGFEYDMDKDGIAWEPQPDAKESFGMPSAPSVEGIQVEELNPEGEDQYQQREMIAGITNERTPVVEDALDMPYVFTSPTAEEIAEIENALLEVKNKEEKPLSGERPTEVRGNIFGSNNTNPWERPDVRTEGDLKGQDKKVA